MSMETRNIRDLKTVRTKNFEISHIMNPDKKVARLAGILYLIMIVCGMTAQILRGNIIVAGDTATTISNIMASGSLFHIAFLSDLIMATCYLFFAWALYVLLKPVNKNIALLFVLLTTASVAILSLNMLNHFAAMLLLSGAGYLSAFSTDQLHALVMFFLDLHYHGYYIAQISFGLWLVPLGYLVYKSGFLPRILGIFLIVATFGHLAGFFTAFLLPGYESFADLVAVLEIPFGLWLLVKGVKDQRPATGPAQNAAVSGSE